MGWWIRTAISTRMTTTIIKFKLRRKVKETVDLVQLFATGKVMKMLKLKLVHIVTTKTITTTTIFITMNMSSKLIVTILRQTLWRISSLFKLLNRLGCREIPPKINHTLITKGPFNQLTANFNKMRIGPISIKYRNLSLLVSLPL